MKITFLGGVGEVTGSRYLIEQEGATILVECGMFQGTRERTERNLEQFPVNPQRIDAVVLTHAHIDHTGYIPALVKKGFKGNIYCSKGTYALCEILLMDSGRLQERQVNDINQRGGPGHPPSVALYTAQDAENALKFFHAMNYDTAVSIGASLKVTLIRSGHILGSSFVIVSDGKETLTFSGDLGRPHQLILKSPPHLEQTDFLVIESTYGDRVHEKGDPIKVLGKIVKETIAKGGVLVMPCFAVERAQTILYCLHQLKQNRFIPNIPVFLDSPMAISVTELLCEFNDEYTLSETLCREITQVATYTHTGEESKLIDEITYPAIIIAGSGMADGGRVMFHLQRFISNARNTVVFVGYQAEGTTGHALVHGEKMVHIQGREYEVRAEIKIMNMFSAHADYNEILEWLGGFKSSPKKVFITHGQPEAADALKHKIEERFGWSVVVPSYLASFDLDEIE